jgi:hypothetical protein
MIDDGLALEREDGANSMLPMSSALRHQLTIKLT